MHDRQKLINAGLLSDQDQSTPHSEHNDEVGNFLHISTPGTGEEAPQQAKKPIPTDGISSTVPTTTTKSISKSNKLINTRTAQKMEALNGSSRSGGSAFPLNGSSRGGAAVGHNGSSRGGSFFSLGGSSRGGGAYAAKNSFVGGDQFMTMNSTTSHVIEPNIGSSRRRRRVNVDAMMRSSVMSQRISRISNMSAAFHPSISGAPNCLPNDVTSVPILGDCSYDQTYSVALSQDDHGQDVGPMGDLPPMARLQALREVIGSVANTNGFVDRATFSQTFEVTGDEYQAYDGGNGMIDGNAILIDAVLDLDVNVEEKLRFIFETMDANKTGKVSEEQIIQLLTTNFASAKIEVVGTDYQTVAELLFRKAGADAKQGMSLDQFRRVFHTYISECYSDQKPSLTPKFRKKSKFDTWYEANRLRVWWVAVYAILNVLAFWLRARTYQVDSALGWGLKIARGCAQVAMLNCLLVLLPMCRSITAVMKRSHIMWKYIPFDDHIEFHKMCGITLLTAGLVHTCAHVANEINLYVFSTKAELESCIFMKRNVFPNGFPPFTTMLLSLPVWTGVLLLTITSISFPLAAIPKFRQGRFNLFWYSHMLFGPFLVIVCFHGANSWLARSSSYMWAIPPFLVYLIERRFRYAKMFAAPVRIFEAVELDKTVALFMEKPRRFVYRPGMYLYINVPAISGHEWHPFTISSAPADNYVSIHVRNAGDWTDALHKLIAECHDKGKEYPDVYLDGPVGAPTQDYIRYKTVICVAGGIGVTPFASILKDVVHMWEEFRCTHCNHVRHPSSFKIQKLYFHWTTRAQESLGWFEKTMTQITNLDQDNVIEAHQYLTSVKGGENASQLKLFQQFVHEHTGHDFVSGMQTKHLTHFGRPDWDQVFEQARKDHPGEEIGVFFCGPHAFDKVLAQMCLKYSSSSPDGTYFDYHSEKFA